jgi:hypothetical protein
MENRSIGRLGGVEAHVWVLEIACMVTRCAKYTLFSANWGRAIVVAQ